MHCSRSPQDPVPLQGPHSPLRHPLTTYMHQHPPTPTRAFSLLQSLWPLHRDKKNHMKCARKERAEAANLRGCKGEGHPNLSAREAKGNQVQHLNLY